MNTACMSDSQAAYVRSLEIDVAIAKGVLRDIAKGGWNSGSRTLDIPAPPYRTANEYAEEALRQMVTA